MDPRAGVDMIGHAWRAEPLPLDSRRVRPSLPASIAQPKRFHRDRTSIRERPSDGAAQAADLGLLLDRDPADSRSARRLPDPSSSSGLTTGRRRRVADSPRRLHPAWPSPRGRQS